MTAPFRLPCRLSLRITKLMDLHSLYLYSTEKKERGQNKKKFFVPPLTQIRLSCRNILPKLCLQSFHIVKFSFRTPKFIQTDFDFLPIDIPVKIIEIGFHTQPLYFLLYGRLIPDIADGSVITPLQPHAGIVHAKRRQQLVRRRQQIQSRHTKRASNPVAVPHRPQHRIRHTQKPLYKPHIAGFHRSSDTRGADLAAVHGYLLDYLHLHTAFCCHTL